MLYTDEVEEGADFDPVDFDALLDDLAAYEPETFDFSGSYEEHEPPHVRRVIELDIENELDDKRRKTSSELAVVHKPTKGKKIKIPRFLVQDIRKTYTKMFQNVLNSCDFALLYGFFETFFGPKPQHTTTRYVRGSSQKIFTMTFNGLDEVAKYWYCMMNLSPDNITMLSDATMQHTTGKIISSMHKRSTHIYEDPPNASSYYAPYIYAEEKYTKEHLYERNPATNEFVVGKNAAMNEDEEALRQQQEQLVQQMETVTVDPEVAAYHRKRAVMREIMNSVENVVSHLPLRNPPQTIGAEGTLTFCTDENKRITKMELSIEY